MVSVVEYGIFFHFAGFVITSEEEEVSGGVTVPMVAAMGGDEGGAGDDEVPGFGNGGEA